nr:transporter substrate-binding domain-containing protein [Arcobacter sp.]
MKNILKTSVISFFIFFIYLEARSLEEIKEDGKIIVAVYEEFPPYSYIENSIEKGIDVDIAKEIAKKIGVKVKWYWTGSDENLDDDLRNVIWKGNLIHKTKADVMFRVPFDYEYIRQRDVSTGELSNELVVMKSPYHAERWVIVSNKEYLPEIKSLANLRTHITGVEIDTLPDAYLTSKLGSSIKHYKNIKDAL